jgi:hypothetical protein
MEESSRKGIETGWSGAAGKGLKKDGGEKQDEKGYSGEEGWKGGVGRRGEGDGGEKLDGGKKWNGGGEV